MTKKNKIALFTGQFESWSGLLIALATRCEFVHCAIYDENTGKWYDASESRGGFGVMDAARYHERTCIAFEFDGSLQEWLDTMTGKRYDWFGIAAWALTALALWAEKTNAKWVGPLRGMATVLAKRIQRPDDFYCFEAGLLALTMCGYNQSGYDMVCGCDLVIIGMEKSLPKTFGRFGDLL